MIIGGGHSHWGVAGADGCRVLGGVTWRRTRSKCVRTRSLLYLLPPPQPHCTSFISCSLHRHRSVNSKDDAGSITRGTGHSRPCSPTERSAWHQDRSLEVHPHVLSPQALIFATCSSLHSSIIYTTTILPNKDHRRSILCLTHRTRSSWSNLDSSLLLQCRTSRKAQRSPHSPNILNAGESGGWSSFRRLSASKGAGSYPSLRLPSRTRNRTKLPLFSTPLPKPR